MMSLRTQRLPLNAKFTLKVVVQAGVKDAVDAGVVRKEEKLSPLVEEKRSIWFQDCPKAYGNLFWGTNTEMMTAVEDIWLLQHLLRVPPPETTPPPIPVVSSCPSFSIDLLLMPERHRGRLTEGSRWLQPAWQAPSSPDRKFGLHQPRGGNCHQETSGLMGWIYALLSSFQQGASNKHRNRWSEIISIHGF